MSALPFLFNAEEFYPLQPEDAEAEEFRRNLPQYADVYVNVAVQKYAELNVTTLPDATVVNPYQQWINACRAMDDETEAARRQWKEAVIEKDAMLAQLKNECERLRMAYRKLQIRNKPAQPRSERNKL